MIVSREEEIYMLIGRESLDISLRSVMTILRRSDIAILSPDMSRALLYSSSVVHGQIGIRKLASQMLGYERITLSGCFLKVLFTYLLYLGRTKA